MDCFVKPCKNKSHQGNFAGNVCVPCAHLARDIAKGELKRSYNFGEGVVQFIADNWREVAAQSCFIRVGESYHIINGPGLPDKIHSENMFKDVYGRTLIIYRWYGRHKQWWHTVMENEDVLLAKIKRCYDNK